MYFASARLPRPDGVCQEHCWAVSVDRLLFFIPTLHFPLGLGGHLPRCVAPAAGGSAHLHIGRYGTGERTEQSRAHLHFDKAGVAKRRCFR